MSAHSLAIGQRRYPLVLPSLRDPRLHVAAVIISVHVLGQVALHFHVSVPQILAAILACAVIEIALTFRQSHSLVWPASAMLTGSGVALILRVVGTPADQPWNTDGWEIFAIVAALSLLTKYVIRYRGSHVFNPSNVGLVVAFIVLGNARIEPLDFWWAPLNPGMIAAYAVIVGGGLLITRRLRLLSLAVAFWLVFAASIGLLAASGHCMTANWAFAPVCGFDYWRTIIASPEVMIFLFFMITDPRTVPAGRVGRVTFGILVALTCTLLMAPMADEFASKVALLAGLVVMCVARPLIDRLAPQSKTAEDDVRRFLARITGLSPFRWRRASLRLGTGGVMAVAVGLAIVLAGIPARNTEPALAVSALSMDPNAINTGTLPPITIDQEVLDFDHELAGPGMDAVVVTLAQNLELENQALLTRDASILTAVDHGDRLDQMRAQLAATTQSGIAVVDHYHFDSIAASLLVPFGQQTGASIGLHGQGTLVEETYGPDGSLQSRSEQPFDLVFAVRRATGARWLNVAVLPPS
jgi:Na+-translocating ferredoxin:NAD+ oxidoreductase RnfD subunit